MKKLLLGICFILSCSKVIAQAEWNFDTTTEGWGNTNSLTSSVNNGILTLTATGADPYIYSPNNLNINASLIKTIRIRVQNNTNQSAFQIYWITNTDQTYNSAKLIQIPITPNLATQKEYVFDFSSVTAWQGTIKQIRLDPGNPASNTSVAIDYIKLTNDAYTLVVDNGILKVKADLLMGGAISYLSKSSDNKNLVNIYDRGRYIQQSYYAGSAINRLAEGQHPSWSPWNWNPIQVGDVYNNSSPVLASSFTDSTIYTKTQPLLWDMNNELAQCHMEMWLSLRGNTIHVKNKLTVFRTDNRWSEIPRHQELPAVYIIGDLYNLYTYTGNAPFTSAAPNKITNAGPPWAYWTTPEHWAALVDANHWGVGVYNGSSTYFVGGYNGAQGGGATSSSTGYMSPLRTETIGKNAVYEYEYDLIVGTLTQIRAFAYAKKNYVLPVTLKDISIKQGFNKNTIVWETLSEQNVKHFVVEKSVNGKDFNAIHTQIAAGNSQTLKYYSFDDYHQERGTVYYRIVTYDQDGTYNTSKIVAAKTQADDTYDVKVEDGKLKLVFYEPFLGTVSLIDMLGKEIFRQELKQQIESYETVLPPLQKGIFLIKLSGKNLNEAKKIVLE
ncbi:T9SS type A sorting domain-containing protein [Pedobacter glucosidilyticus]|uniref:T9SS type A sorting domain-containing protein n=1 Tax=Pedobacter glucosidilyticus TaxID=1122941 RepID=UPI0026F096BE|nr:T9SS type A sorting domain-containing protein [Pedobacter glucosidilyticus]